VSVELTAQRLRGVLPDWSWLPEPGPGTVRPTKA